MQRLLQVAQPALAKHRSSFDCIRQEAEPVAIGCCKPNSATLLFAETQHDIVRRLHYTYIAHETALTWMLGHAWQAMHNYLRPAHVAPSSPRQIQIQCIITMSAMGI